MVIDPDSKLPLYYQLKEKIKENILNGTFKEGDLLPAERELSEKYNLSSTTVRRALNDLVYESFLERKAGKGTFVRMRRVKRDLRKVLGFTDNMKEMGLVPTTKVLSKTIIKATEFVRNYMEIGESAEVVKLERLRLADNVPMMLETRYIRIDLCPGIIEYELDSSLWNVFENVYGRKPYRHSQTLRVATISGDSAALLGIEENSYIYLIKGATYLKDGQAIECEQSYYRSDRYELSFEAIAE